MKARPILLLAAAALAACVPYPAELLPTTAPILLPNLITGAFPGLDAGANEQTSLHFKVRAYGPQYVQDVAALAEEDYARIMNDTGLYSFQPHGTYEIIVYGSQDEYRKKTGQPEWSAGVTVGNAIYLFTSPTFNGVLSHEMTHLIWYEFMSGRLIENQRWVNEGWPCTRNRRRATTGASCSPAC